MRRNRFQKPDWSHLRRLFIDLGWLFGSFAMFSVGFIYEVKKGNGAAACMFAGAIIMILKTLEFGFKSLKR